ncbi:site-specific DNA-methyltransferase [Neisseria meningitidis]|nr:site-specific DNA-methyltransferase [Neisseria meningitidis]MBH2491093.1 site-specific DNA-methyltransferase [Neisseria meningitidis]MBH2506179.1 site-specific DNA-methyltransferase [Neisseria meningitidis]MBH5414795.1 site-specific DNA-methyltransferase [Neisseria meningitidis]MBH5422734.1 site-specific DNA-methyltransferase [Neisseria meningitidis]
MDGRRNYGNRTEPNRTEPNRTEPNRTEIIHDLEDNFKQNNILKLKQLFPEVFCEDQIDFEKLKLVLGAENLAGAGERYQLDWAGKTASYLNLQSPTSRTLVPCKEESADFDGTQNVFIEAENLEALKILQKSYAGSVKMIYIDPPYNTGSDSFIYPDKFSESREEYARRVGDTDDAGYLKRDGVFQGAWRKNGKDSGHYHSNWLSMMLPRLHLAKTLLREDGVIFISIDDNEQAQLKLLCDEVFGAENFVSQISWHRKRGKDNSAPNLSRVHEYLFVYAKNIENLRFNKLEIEAETLKAYKNPDNDERGDYRVLGLWARGNQGGSRYEYTTLNGRFYSEREWLVGLENMKKLDEEKRLIENGDKLYRKLFLSEVAGSVPETIWLDTSNTANAADELKKIFDKKAYFDTPKPIPYLLKMAKLATNSDDLILDFFSGSGTTAHAVMQLNAEDGGSRRFICVQLPEETDEKSEARKAGFDTIAEIAKERIRRAGRQISDGLQSGQNVDTGFKVFKLAESGFKQWRQSGQADTEALQGELSLNIDSVLSETPSENLLCELMLRLGLKLTCKVSLSDGVYFVEDEDTGGLYAFLLERVNQDLIDAVLAKHPVKAVVLDRLFEGDDALKGNTVLQMKDAGVMFECV